MPTDQTVPIRVKAIDHVTVVVSDLERSSKFYVEVLGMQPVSRPDFGFPGQWFQAGQTQVHMNLASPEAGAAGLRSLGTTDLTRGFHYAFQVDDCRAAAARLDAMNIPVTLEPRNRPDGAVQMYLYDPDKHLVELFSLPKS